MAELTWARKWIEGQRIGYAPEQPGDVLESGAVVLVEAVSEDADGKAYEAEAYGLRQLPNVNGGLVALAPHTGRVLAMAGAFSSERREFNPVTPARPTPRPATTGQ